MTDAEKYAERACCSNCEMDSRKCTKKCLAAKYAIKGYEAGVKAERDRGKENERTQSSRK